MQEQLISFEVAKLAKEKGFHELVSNCYYKEELFGTYVMMDENDSAFIDVMDGNELENHNSLDFIDYKYRFSAPTQSLLQKWLREEYKIHLVCWWYDKQDKFYTELGRHGENTIKVQTGNVTNLFNTYEEALEAGLIESLKLI